MGILGLSVRTRIVRQVVEMEDLDAADLEEVERLRRAVNYRWPVIFADDEDEDLDP